MGPIKLALAAASLCALAACGGKGDDATGDIVASDANAAADTMEAQADTMPSDAAADIVDARADALRDAGDAAEESIDDADISTSNPAATAAVIEERAGMPTSDKTQRDAMDSKQ